MSGVMVLLKMPSKYRKLKYNKNKNAPKDHAYGCRICRAWYKQTIASICCENMLGYL